MLRSVSASVEFYGQVLSAFPDTESLTVVVASGVTREAVLEALGRGRVSTRRRTPGTSTRESTAWAAVEVPGGVLAMELSGYGDPSTADLASLSHVGRLGGGPQQHPSPLPFWMRPGRRGGFR